MTAYRRALEDQAILFFGTDALFTSITQPRFAEYVAHLRSNACEGQNKNLSTYLFLVEVC